MSYTVTPYQYLRRYKDGVPVKLGAKFDEMVFFVEIEKYRNNSLSGAEKGCEGWVKRRAAVRKKAKAAIAAAGGHTEGSRVHIPMACGDLYHAFNDHVYDEGKVIRTYTGKGSPEEIGEVLSAAIAVGVFHPDEVWEHVRKYVGLDCNGFVGNWARANKIKVGGRDAEANTSLLDYASTNKDKKRTEAVELRQGDVLVWLKSPHIAVVDSVVDPEMGTFMVCESSGSFGGLKHSLYRWTSKEKAVETFEGTNRLLGRAHRKAMKADLADGEADLKNEDGKKVKNWIKAAKSYGDANKVIRVEKGSGEWISAHGLNNVHN